MINKGVVVVAMSKQQKDKLQELLVRYIVISSEGAIYGEKWGEHFIGSDVLKKFRLLENELRKLNIDFNKLSEADCRILGCSQDSKNTKYWYIPIYLYNVITNGTIVRCIDGEDKIWGIDYIDNDSRGGYLAYMFKAI